MGKLHYGSPPESFDIDDRALAHVELVVVAKLRRGESFALTVDLDGGARETMWVGPAAALRFSIGDSPTEINREWLEILMESANTTAGLKITPEPTRD